MFRRRLLNATILTLPMIMGVASVQAATTTKTTAATKAPSTPSKKATVRKRHAAVTSTSSENLIVTGTHSANRHARQSISPVTVLSAATLKRSGTMNLAQQITQTYASIAVETMGSDAAALVSSIHMRGLSSNEVLVLVDGKRRHTTANFTADSGPNFGTTGVDINMIPSDMVDHIEVLEDGSAAMYGSDAIAGVVNIITNKKDHGFHTYAQTGANAYNGDGWQYQVGADAGFKLGHNGFLHLFGQVYHTDHFVAKGAYDHRLVGSQPADAAVSSFSAPGLNVPATSNHIQSTPEETRENFGLTWGKDLNEHVNFYGNITYTHRHSEAYENYRVPNVGSGVAYQYYPAGFSPLETIEENDYAALIGAKGDNVLGFSWDVSSTYGADYDKIGNKNTVNTGMLQSTCSTDTSSAYYSSAGCGFSPTTTRAESYNLAQWTNNVDFRRNINIFHTVPMTLAFGGEHRLEMYQIWPGTAASYALGGTQGYAGLAPQNAGKWSRDIWAAYLDGDFHFTKKWETDFAGRFEHYTDVGNNEIGKISTRYDFTKRIGIRATISTGFRAPTLAEQHFSAMNVSPTGASGLLAASSSAAASLGARPLKPERSTSESAGIVLEPIRGLHVEADVYQINIRDRIVQGGTVNGQTAIDAIENLGFSLPGNSYVANSVSAYYLSNGASTRTQGLDIKADYTFHMHEYGNLALNMQLSLNRTRLHHNGTYVDPTTGETKEYLNAQNISYITTAYPRSKIILNAYYTLGKWDFNLRQTRWGQTTSMLSYEDWAPAALQFSNTDFYHFVNTPHWTTDILVGYRFNDHLHFSVGANNIFNVRPRRVPAANSYLGAVLYSSSSMQIPMFGGYYFGRFDVNF